MKYTPGEWEIVVSPDGRHRHIMSLFDGMHKNICALSVRSIEETEANARLIAQSPSMRDACVSALTLLDAQGHPDDPVLQAVIRQLKDAIAKATGGTK